MIGLFSYFLSAFYSCLFSFFLSSRLFNFCFDVERLSLAGNYNYWTGVRSDVLLSLFSVCFLGTSCQTPHINLARVCSARCRDCLASILITMLRGNLQQTVSCCLPPPSTASREWHPVFSVWSIGTIACTLSEGRNTPSSSFFLCKIYI